MAEFYINLHLFGDGAGASAAPAAGTGDGGEAAEVAPGTLEDGTVVDNRLAARMEEQARKRRDRGERPATAAKAAAVSAQQSAQQEQPAAAEEPAEPSLEDQWNEAKKGKFREFIGRDIQNAIQERFKNQSDANETLRSMKPMLDALMKKSGAESIDELSKMILDDDSLYEEEAEKLGMTVEGYKTYQEMQAENQRLRAQEERDREQFMLRQHFQNLANQGEEMKKQFPDFDLRKEMENETFRRLVAPNSGLKVADAYYAVHHAEIAPQAMQYGFQKAQQQMSQTLQANRARPVEGAVKGGKPADVAVDPRSMSREERQRLIERARRGEKIVI
jgi:hypothetical protein